MSRLHGLAHHRHHHHEQQQQNGKCFATWNHWYPCNSPDIPSYSHVLGIIVVLSLRLLLFCNAMAAVDGVLGTTASGTRSQRTISGNATTSQRIPTSSAAAAGRGVNTLFVGQAYVRTDGWLVVGWIVVSAHTRCFTIVHQSCHDIEQSTNTIATVRATSWTRSSWIE